MFFKCTLKCNFYCVATKFIVLYMYMMYVLIYCWILILNVYRLKHIPRPKMKICILGDQVHCDQAKANDLPSMDTDSLKKLNKDKKLVKKLGTYKIAYIIYECNILMLILSCKRRCWVYLVNLFNKHNSNTNNQTMMWIDVHIWVAEIYGGGK